MIWFPEGYWWPRRRIPWVAVINPLSSTQTVTVALMRESAPSVVQSFTVAARSRVSREVSELFSSLRPEEAFGLEVECAGACAASLVMWDAQYSTPAVSAPIVGCR